VEKNKFLERIKGPDFGIEKRWSNKNGKYTLGSF